MVYKIKNFLAYIIYALCAICFSYLLVNILFRNEEYNYNKLALSACIIVVICLLTLIYRLFSKHEAFLDKHYKPILISFLIGMMILQIVFGLFLRFKPDFDMESVYQGAIDWVQTGSFNNYYNYYYYFPNNLGSMGFLHFFFKIASIFGIKDFFLVGMFLNSVLSISMMLVVSLICKRILGIKQAVISLVFIAFTLPFYFIAPVYYTDALSMLFPVLFYYFYLVWKDTTDFKKQCIMVALMGISASIGMQIKFTVVVMVIAVTIDMIINLDWRRFVFANAGVYAIILICFTAFNAYIYTYHLDRQQAKQQNDPYTHWMMMGLKGTGGYNPDDYNYTRSFSDPDERKKANIEEIKRRISDYGPDGLFEFLTKKGVKNFGDGTLGFDDFLADTKERNLLHKFVISEGEKYNIYRHICEGVQFSSMVFMIIPAFGFIIGSMKNKKGKNNLSKGQQGGNYTPITPILGVFGIFIFLLMWEANRRYFSNFLPVIIVAAVLGMDCIFTLAGSIPKFAKKSIG